MRPIDFSFERKGSPDMDLAAEDVAARVRAMAEHLAEDAWSVQARGPARRPRGYAGEVRLVQGWAAGAAVRWRLSPTFLSVQILPFTRTLRLLWWATATAVTALLVQVLLQALAPHFNFVHGEPAAWLPWAFVGGVVAAGTAGGAFAEAVERWLVRPTLLQQEGWMILLGQLHRAVIHILTDRNPHLPAEPDRD